MGRLSLAVLSILAGCTSPEYQAWQAENEKYASTGQTSSGEVESTAAVSGSTSTTGGDDAGVSATATAGTTDPADSTGTAGTTGTTGTWPEDPPIVEPDLPSILSIELPAKVYAAGPVPLAVQTEHTGAVRIRLDGVEAGDLIAAGEGLFTGEVPVHGAVDNGSHEIEVIARLGPYEDCRTANYEVATPKPGTEAWSKAGPTGSRTNRVALTPTGDLIEVGQTEINGVARPTIRKRSGTTGAELWPAKTITLDTREGAVVDVAVLQDGRMWVAMNVNDPGKDPQPRIALLDADGHATGVEALGSIGRVVRGIAADAEGGCFAVGLAAVQGDWDIAYWRINAAGVQTLGDAFDYWPLNIEPHSFRDLANDVLIDGDVAWVVGLSQGKHDKDIIRTRGILVPMALNTGEVSAPVIVAPKLAVWTQSAFFGAALHPDGVLVTGYGCDETCATYRIETSLYNVAGVRTWHQAESPNSGLAYGSDIALDSQGRALVAGVVTQNGKLRGYVFGRAVHQNGVLLLDHWFPGVGASEGLGILTDGFDRIFPVGYTTANGSIQARITLIHG